MAQLQSPRTGNPAVDPKSPWKITLRDWDWSYGYKSSPSAWRRLLARARQGDPEAEWEVAERYADGSKDLRGNILVKRSTARATPWFRRAAEHGSVPAQNTLGVLLSSGKSAGKNVEEALRWFKKAFRAGEQAAAQNIAITYRENGDFKSAVQWLQKAVRAGDGDAYVQLGIHYYWGKGVSSNPKAAVRCFRAAIKAKNISGAGRDDAFFFLGIAYQEGRGVSRSTLNAKKFLKQANVDGDHPPARAMLETLRPARSAKRLRNPQHPRATSPAGAA
ncbi:MAG TPA: tetratricopeptide repeat protein [Candidatus Acidoferrales bacterium]